MPVSSSYLSESCLFLPVYTTPERPGNSSMFPRLPAMLPKFFHQSQTFPYPEVLPFLHQSSNQAVPVSGIFFLFSSDHGLFFFLGVNFCIVIPSIFLTVVSIHPKHSASFTASRYQILFFGFSFPLFCNNPALFFFTGIFFQPGSKFLPCCKRQYIFSFHVSSILKNKPSTTAIAGGLFLSFAASLFFRRRK